MARMEDFDFPMSWDFYRGLSMQNGYGDPGSNRLETLQEPILGQETENAMVDIPEVPKPSEIQQIKGHLTHQDKTLYRLEQELLRVKPKGDRL